MMKRIIAFAVSVVGFSSFAHAKDVNFDELFKNVTDGVIVAETAPEDTLVFKGGTFELNDRSLTIKANNIRVDGDTLILGYPWTNIPAPIPDTPPGVGTSANGGTWNCVTSQRKISPFNITIQITQCPFEGQDGFTGNTGATGTGGAAARRVEVDIQHAEGTAVLAIIANGQRGGKGQQGGPGGTGGIGVNGDNRAGDVFCRGQNSRLDGASGGRGGKGGTGGQGGPGGPGGTVLIKPGDTITVATLNDDAARGFVVAAGPSGAWASIGPTGNARVLVAAPGGFGGEGGDEGGAGTSGPGGNAGGRSHCGGGGNPGPPVSSFGVGDRGPGGVLGATGTASIEQRYGLNR